jgi:glycosyltransferase involved in cell wall biosynthesis
MWDKRGLIESSNIILFVVNAPEFFLSHRLPLAIAAQKAGFKVHVATAEGAGVDKIRAEGFTHHVIPVARSGQNPLSELATLLYLVKLFRRLKPALVHLITIKPVLYGGIAARLAGVQSVVSAVSGLGTVFLADSFFARIRRGLVVGLYRAAFKQKRLAVIFQNPDDRDVLLGLKALKAEQVRMIRGSGVALADYPCLPEPEGKPVMAARLLKDKGVFEFVQAARLLRKRGLSVDMRLIGSPDPGNPSSVTQQELDEWEAEGHNYYIDNLGSFGIISFLITLYIVSLTLIKSILKKSMLSPIFLFLLINSMFITISFGGLSYLSIIFTIIILTVNLKKINS